MLTLTIVIQNGLQLIADEFTREPKLQARANLDTHYLGTKICESELPSDRKPIYGMYCDASDKCILDILSQKQDRRVDGNIAPALY